MIRWLRVVVPLWGLVTVGAFFLMMEAYYLILEWRLRIPYDSFPDDGMFAHLICLVTAVYALYRVRAFHPALRSSYRNWLSLTPWTVKKPLPLGPIHLVWQDVFLLGITVGFCWPRAEIGSLEVVKAFLGCYLASLCVVHVLTGQKAWAYPVAFGLGFMILFVRSPLFFAFAGVTYVVALFGLRASLSRFPWHEELRFQKMPGVMTDSISLGWPFGRLGPSHSKKFKLSDVFLTGLLAGWAVFVILSSIRKFEDGRGIVPFVFLGVFGRILIYCHSYVPPLSLWGRIALGRLIIPGYDKVFIAPLLALFVFIIATTLHQWIGVTQIIDISIGVTAYWWILFGMGPSLNDWRLTGNHRIVKGILLTGEQQKR
ncbi:MAG TPA: hypothetical protein VG097_13370 [Gemmata sp.]|jgi:hypothetical protein|nr:hypothetical protein [Gemmata sp.]